MRLLLTCFLARKNLLKIGKIIVCNSYPKAIAFFKLGDTGHNSISLIFADLLIGKNDLT